jgi:tRNA U34 5-carboxymethylaminomethyl modifying GTPase MnmE/TrmE
MSLDLSASSHKEVRAFLERVEKVLEARAYLDQQLPTSASGFAAAAARAADQRGRYQEPFRLVVVGDFNAGKSSVINCIVGRRGFLLEGITPTTGAITEIWWADEEAGSVSVRGEILAEGPLAEIAPYSDQRTPQGRSISGQGATITLQADVPLLRDLVIVDTPGLGANQRDDSVTLGHLDLADAAILVVSALQPGGDETVRLAERLRRTQRRILCVVTHLDVTDDPEEAIETVHDLLGDSILGAPIRFNSPAVLGHLEALEAAQDAEDEQAAENAQQGLGASGHTELLERLQESFVLGDAADRRLVNVLASVQSSLMGLSSITQERIGALGGKLTEVQTKLSDDQRHVHGVLQPKIPYLDQKIDQTVEVHVSEFVSDLSEAVDVFLDKLAADKFRTGVRALMAMGRDRRRRFNAELKDEFDEIFPPSQLEITQRAITRSVESLLRAEWGKADLELAASAEVSTFDGRNLAGDVARQVGQLAAQIGGTLLTYVVTLFVPGGIIVDATFLLLSALATGSLGRASRRSEQRLAISKHEAKVRLRACRRELVDQLAGHYRDLNRKVADELISAVLGDESAHKSAESRLIQSLADWKDAHAEARRLWESADGYRDEAIV